MGNMSYVRYENTLRDLGDCEDNLPLEDVDDLSESEKKARGWLIANTAERPFWLSQRPRASGIKLCSMQDSR